MGIEVEEHSRTMHSFLAGTHAWFEREALSSTKIETEGVQAWGLVSLDLAREHSLAVLQLLDPSRPRFFGSAAALQRPILESLLRGYFFSFCTLSAREINDFQEARQSWGQDWLLARIEKVQPHFAADIRSFHSLVKNALHRYTHGDVHQLSRRFAIGAEAGTPKISEGDVISFLALTTRLTLYAMLGMLDHFSNAPAVPEIMLRRQELDRLENVGAELLSQDEDEKKRV